MIEPFKDPQLAQLTPLTIRGDVIYGHFCKWGQSHMAAAGVTPPRTGDGRYFHLSGYDWNGTELDVGKITLHTHHAPIRATSQAAVDHYEHTGCVAAYVRAGDDAHGGWFCGRVATGLDDADLEALRGATPSGDWRPYNGKRELIGMLAVNVPGFPIERERVLLASGSEREPLALVASGLVLNEAGAPDQRVAAARARLALSRRVRSRQRASA